MNKLTARQIEETVGLVREDRCSGLGCEAQLRVAATTLAAAPLDMISAATVVGVLGQDDAHAFANLVADIADEFGLEAKLRLHLGSFSVRFYRPVTADANRLGCNEASTDGEVHANPAVSS
jgi:hypothetical protein